MGHKVALNAREENMKEYQAIFQNEKMKDPEGLKAFALRLKVSFCRRTQTYGQAFQSTSKDILPS